MTPAHGFKVIHGRNCTMSMEVSFFGMPLYILDMCPENRDESNGNSILRLWLQFIPIFGALHSQLRKGPTKKRHLHAHGFFAGMPLLSGERRQSREHYKLEESTSMN